MRTITALMAVSLLSYPFTDTVKDLAVDSPKSSSADSPNSVAPTGQLGATVAESSTSAALAIPNVQKHLEGKTIRKVVVVPGKLVSIVV